MEYYGARTAAPLAKVLDDVAGCDAYVGIFGWRYGYRPEPTDHPPRLAETTPGETSITEYEYRKAVSEGLEILSFLVDERAPWPAHLIDGVVRPDDADAVQRFRSELQRQRLVAYFSTPDSLATRVATAVSTLGMRSEVMRRILAPLRSDTAIPLLASEPLYDSYVEALKTFVSQSTQARSATVDVGETWWSTRLYLLAVIGEALGRLRRIVFVDGKQLVGVVSTETTRRTMLRLHDGVPSAAPPNLMPDGTPRLREFERLLAGSVEAGGLDEQLNLLIEHWTVTVGEQDQFIEHFDVTPANLDRWFGDGLLRNAVEVADLSALSAIELLRILDYPNDFVPVSENRQRRRHAVQLIDRSALTEQMARNSVQEMLDRIGIG